MKLLLLMVILSVWSVNAAKEKAIKVKDKDMMRKMIIYDKVIMEIDYFKAFFTHFRFYFPEKSKHVLLSRSQQNTEVI